MRKRGAVAFVAAALLVLSACSDGDGPKLAKPKRTATTAAFAGASTTAVDANGAGEGSDVASDQPSRQGSALGSYRTDGDYQNGRHIGKVNSFDDSTVGVDVVQFLTGDEAKEAYAKDTGSSDGPDNDYYVRNPSATVRLFPVDDDVVIRVNTTGGYEPSAPNEGRRISTATFAEYFERGPVEGLFWITIEDGDVVAIEEQYLP